MAIFLLFEYLLSNEDAIAAPWRRSVALLLAHSSSGCEGKRGS